MNDYYIKDIPYAWDIITKVKKYPLLKFSQGVSRYADLDNRDNHLIAVRQGDTLTYLIKDLDKIFLESLIISGTNFGLRYREPIAKSRLHYFFIIPEITKQENAYHGNIFIRKDDRQLFCNCIYEVIYPGYTAEEYENNFDFVWSKLPIGVTNLFLGDIYGIRAQILPSKFLTSKGFECRKHQNYEIEGGIKFTEFQPLI